MFLSILVTLFVYFTFFVALYSVSLISLPNTDILKYDTLAWVVHIHSSVSNLYQVLQHSIPFPHLCSYPVCMFVYLSIAD